MIEVLDGGVSMTFGFRDSAYVYFFDGYLELSFFTFVFGIFDLFDP